MIRKYITTRMTTLRCISSDMRKRKPLSRPFGEDTSASDMYMIQSFLYHDTISSMVSRIIVVPSMYQ